MNKYILDVDRETRENYPGEARTFGWGSKPAVLVVDLQVGFTDPAKSSVAFADYRDVIEQTNRILAAARASTIPCMFVVLAFRDEREAAIGFKKAARNFVEGSEPTQMDPRVDYRPTEDLLFFKRHSSGFFETPLQSTLLGLGIDTLICTGTSTNGCVRKTVTDAAERGYRVIIPEEAVGNLKSRVSHIYGLFDMDHFYGDVVSVEEVIEHLST